MRALIRSKVDAFTIFSSLSCSMRENGPRVSRRAKILVAVTGPMPGSDSSIFWDAVFKLIDAPGAGAGDGAPLAGGSCADAGSPGARRGGTISFGPSAILE